MQIPAPAIGHSLSERDSALLSVPSPRLAQSKCIIGILCEVASLSYSKPCSGPWSIQNQIAGVATQINERLSVSHRKAFL